MVYRGHVKNGKVELDQDLALPEGAAVVVTLSTGGEMECTHQEHQQGPTLYEHLKPFIGSAKGLPPDAAINVDHYLYGHPKR